MRRVLWYAGQVAYGKSLRVLPLLRQLQQSSTEAIQSMQDRRRLRLIEHSWRTVPFYRRRLQGLYSASTPDLGRWHSIPFLSKDDIRSHFSEMTTTQGPSRDWRHNASGGSTGEPIRLVQDAEYRDWNRAVKVLFDEWTGYRPGEAKVLLWGSERDLLVGRETLATYLRRWVKNELWLNAFHLPAPRLAEYVRAINDYQPVQVTAYVESAHDLARFVLREGLTLHRPRAILTTAGTLHPPARRTIEAAFGAPVYDRYGSREVGDIACECSRHMGLHLCPATHYVELVTPDGTPAPPGEPGEVVVTLLTNLAMPIIRYRIGDMAVWSSEACSCGIRWPLLERVLGRTTDVFVAADGARVHGQYFAHLFYYQDWVRQFQVVQESVGQVTVKIVPVDEQATPESRRDSLTQVSADIRQVLGQECAVSFDFTGQIPPSPSGKHLHTLSYVEGSGN